MRARSGFVGDADAAGNGPSEPSGATYDDRIGRALWGCSDATSPIKAALLENEVFQCAPRPNDNVDTVPGLTGRLELVRSGFIKQCQSRDMDAIAPTEKFTTQLPCGVLHPGLCRKDIDENLASMSLNLIKIVSSWTVGTVLGFEVFEDNVPEDASICPQVHYKCLAARADAMMVSCTRTARGLEFTTMPPPLESIVNFEMGITALSNIFVAGMVYKLELTKIENRFTHFSSDDPSFLPRGVPTICERHVLYPLPPPPESLKKDAKTEALSKLIEQMYKEFSGCSLGGLLFVIDAFLVFSGCQVLHRCFIRPLLFPSD